MEPREYTVLQINGDYAYLKRTDREEAEPVLVARALLPAEIDEGSELIYELLEYRMKGDAR